MGKIRILIVVCFLVLCLTGYRGIAYADEQKIIWETLGGSETSSKWENSQYLGIGLIKPWRENYWLLVRVMTLNAGYKFHINDDTLKGRIFSTIPYMGLRRSINGSSVTLFTGPVIQKKNQEMQSGDRDKNSKTGVSVQVELDKWWQKDKNLSFIINYATIDNFFWGRLRGKKGVCKIGKGNLFLGMEMVGMGNADFAGYQIGAVTEGMNILPNFTAGLKAGVKHSSSFSNSRYAGIDFYYSF